MNAPGTPTMRFLPFRLSRLLVYTLSWGRVSDTHSCTHETDPSWASSSLSSTPVLTHGMEERASAFEPLHAKLIRSSLLSPTFMLPGVLFPLNLSCGEKVVSLSNVRESTGEVLTRRVIVAAGVNVGALRWNETMYGFLFTVPHLIHRQEILAKDRTRRHRSGQLVQPIICARLIYAQSHRPHKHRGEDLGARCQKRGCFCALAYKSFSLPWYMLVRSPRFRRKASLPLSRPEGSCCIDALVRGESRSMHPRYPAML